MDRASKEQAGEAGMLQAFLAERDCACPGCGYNLRNLESSRCPECAMEVRLGVRLAEPRLGALICGVVALAAGAGFGALLLGFGVIMTMTSGPAGGMRPFFLVNGVALWAWPRCWKYVRKWGDGQRMGLALACWVLPVLAMLALVKWVR